MWVQEKIQWEEDWLIVLYFRFPLKCRQSNVSWEQPYCYDTHIKALSESELQVAFKNESRVIIMFPINPLHCLCEAWRAACQSLIVSLNQMNTDGDLGPFEHFPCLLSLCLSSGSFCIWLCLYIFHVHHTNLPFRSNIFYFDLTPWLTSTNLCWHTVSSHCLILSF